MLFQSEIDSTVLAVASAAIGYFCCCHYRHCRWWDRERFYCCCHCRAVPESERYSTILPVASASTGYFCCCHYRHHCWQERIFAAAADRQSTSPTTCQKPGPLKLMMAQAIQGKAVMYNLFLLVTLTRMQSILNLCQRNMLVDGYCWWLQIFTIGEEYLHMRQLSYFNIM